MCSPESASRCDAPLFRKVRTVSRDNPLRSPVRKALSRGAVPPEGKGTVSIMARSRPAGTAAQRSSSVSEAPPAKESVSTHTIPHRRKAGKRSAPRSVRRTAATSDARTRKSPPERRYGSTEVRSRSAPAAAPAVKWTANASMFSAPAISFKFTAKIQILFVNFARIDR